MCEVDKLLLLTKNIAKTAYQKLVQIDGNDFRQVHYSQKHPREMKSGADTVMEELILDQLLPTGISVLSEESGELSKGSRKSHMRFVVDPLDGTVNFVRELAPCSISIALCNKMQPIFGVLMIYPSGDLAWGGKEIGAFLENIPISVSTFTDCSQSILCTGFPSRYSFDDKNTFEKQTAMMSKFGKVRMLGSASNSLLQVAKGSAEAYSEQEIMFWDVAAGLALVEGAGGKTEINHGSTEHATNVTATNGFIEL
jgi:myo-inositol-1(or 4)-monophosphatase